MDGWSMLILNQYGWKSYDQLLLFLKSVTDHTFIDHKLTQKHLFIKRLQFIITSIERNGAFLHDTKDMFAPGALMEHMAYEYNAVRRQYLKSRKELKKQLYIINTFLRDY